jgi:hypothetical protein
MVRRLARIVGVGVETAAFTRRTQLAIENPSRRRLRLLFP